jgi:hypothetical protein
VTDEGRRIIAFYGGGAPDDRGRSLGEILKFDDDRLEHAHDFIQWLFPLPERSGANPSAPVLDDAAISAFRTRSELRAALCRSLDRMLAFYGFAWSGDRIVKSATFLQRSDWLSTGNHNHLRLTRMMRSLNLLGERQAALALFDALSDVYDEERRTRRSRISDRTFYYWKLATEAGPSWDR